MNIDEIGYYKIADFILREPPARDECLKVVTRDADMHEFGDFSDVARRESLHRHMTNEMTSVDMAAACVAEFPDAPWGLRMELARQAWDEATRISPGASMANLRERLPYKRPADLDRFLTAAHRAGMQ